MPSTRGVVDIDVDDFDDDRVVGLLSVRASSTMVWLYLHSSAIGESDRGSFRVAPCRARDFLRSDGFIRTGAGLIHLAAAAVAS
jgi:hypothetical protein